MREEGREPQGYRGEFQEGDRVKWKDEEWQIIDIDENSREVKLAKVEEIEMRRGQAPRLIEIAKESELQRIRKAA